MLAIIKYDKVMQKYWDILNIDFNTIITVPQMINVTVPVTVDIGVCIVGKQQFLKLVVLTLHRWQDIATHRQPLPLV